MFKMLRSGLISIIFMIPASVVAGQLSAPLTVTGITVEDDHLRVYLSGEVLTPIAANCSVKDELVILNTNAIQPELYAAMLVAKTTQEQVVFEVDSCAVTHSGSNTPELVGVRLGE